MNQTNLILAALFNPERVEQPDAWLGHMPFASWVVREVEPRLFVELGTHSGNSYFSFCQAVKEQGLATKCYAVDTWCGDEHSGRYDESIFTGLNSYHNERYASFSNLLRMSFDEAVGYFSDHSIDLLHIDGLHTYEAVRHDFETWLPKLRSGAIVLFHDTVVRERGFGVWRFWEELQSRYPRTIEFFHSNGLGVLQVDGGTNPTCLDWLNPESTHQKLIVEYFAALGMTQMDRFALREARRTIQAIGQDMAADKRALHDLNQVLSERNAEIVKLGLSLDECDGRVAAMAQTAGAYGDQITALSHVLAECNERISLLNNSIGERDEKIAELFKVVSERDEKISQVEMSRSWKFTDPLRRAARAYREIRVNFRLPEIPRKS